VTEKCDTNGNLNYFSYFIYRLKLKVKRLKNGIKIVCKGGDLTFWGFLKAQVYAVKKPEIFVTLGRGLQTVVLLSIPLC
jgi:hypothetical protein